MSKRTPVDDVCKLMRKAARIIDTRGLCKFRYEDEAGRLCVQAALAVADGGEPTDANYRMNKYPRQVAATKRLIAFLVSRKVRTVDSDDITASFWQNRPHIRKAHVVDALRAASRFATQPRREEIEG